MIRSALRRTAWKKRPRKRHPRELREGKAEYGPTWKSAADLARKRDSGRCVVCGIKPSNSGKRHGIHHIIALRMFSGSSLDPHNLRNLATLCNTGHARITHLAEPKLLDGDIVGFWRAMVGPCCFPVELLREAFKYFGLPEVA